MAHADKKKRKAVCAQSYTFRNHVASEVDYWIITWNQCKHSLTNLYTHTRADELSKSNVLKSWYLLGISKLASPGKIKHKEVSCSQNRQMHWSYRGNICGSSHSSGDYWYYKVEVEQANIKNLPELFLYADDASIRTHPLLGEFGSSGDTHTGEKVTAGSYIPPDNTYEYTHILTCLKCPPNVTESSIKDIFSTDDYVDRWKIRREKTSS